MEERIQEWIIQMVELLNEWINDWMNEWLNLNKSWTLAYSAVPEVSGGMGVQADCYAACWKIKKCISSFIFIRFIQIKEISVFQKTFTLTIQTVQSIDAKSAACLRSIFACTVYKVHSLDARSAARLRSIFTCTKPRC